MPHLLHSRFGCARKKSHTSNVNEKCKTNDNEEAQLLRGENGGARTSGRYLPRITRNDIAEVGRSVCLQLSAIGSSSAWYQVRCPMVEYYRLLTAINGGVLLQNPNQLSLLSIGALANFDGFEIAL